MRKYLIQISVKIHIGCRVQSSNLLHCLKGLQSLKCINSKETCTSDSIL